MPKKFDDDIFTRVLVIMKNVVISYVMWLFLSLFITRHITIYDPMPDLYKESHHHNHFTCYNKISVCGILELMQQCKLCKLLLKTNERVSKSLD